MSREKHLILLLVEHFSFHSEHMKQQEPQDLAFGLLKCGKTRAETGGMPNNNRSTSHHWTKILTAAFNSVSLSVMINLFKRVDGEGQTLVHVHELSRNVCNVGHEP